MLSRHPQPVCAAKRAAGDAAQYLSLVARPFRCDLVTPSRAPFGLLRRQFAAK